MKIIVPHASKQDHSDLNKEAKVTCDMHVVQYWVKH